MRTLSRMLMISWVVACIFGCEFGDGGVAQWGPEVAVPQCPPSVIPKLKIHHQAKHPVVKPITVLTL